MSKPTNGTTCGTEHPRRREATCQSPNGHDRWAHEWSHMTIDDDGTMLWETLAWIDLPELTDSVAALKRRREARALARACMVNT